MTRSSFEFQPDRSETSLNKQPSWRLKISFLFPILTFRSFEDILIFTSPRSPVIIEMSSRKTAGRRGTTKKRAQRATSNVFAMFNQEQIQEFKEAFNMVSFVFVFSCLTVQVSFCRFKQFRLFMPLPELLQIDQNRDGFIDKEDLHDMLASLGKDPTDDYLEGMMNEAPGPINFTMFLTLFGERLQGICSPENFIGVKVFWLVNSDVSWVSIKYQRRGMKLSVVKALKRHLSLLTSNSRHFLFSNVSRCYLKFALFCSFKKTFIGLTSAWHMGGYPTRVFLLEVR